MNQLLHSLNKIIYSYKQAILILWVVLIISSIIILISGKAVNIENELAGVTNTEAYKVNQIVEQDFKIKIGTADALVIIGKVELEKLKADLQHSFPQIL